jgi:hypothetical protein
MRTQGMSTAGPKKGIFGPGTGEKGAILPFRMDVSPIDRCYEPLAKSAVAIPDRDIAVKCLRNYRSRVCDQ